VTEPWKVPNSRSSSELLVVGYPSITKKSPLRACIGVREGHLRIATIRVREPTQLSAGRKIHDKEGQLLVLPDERHIC
jgi:hypothetical protein